MTSFLGGLCLIFVAGILQGVFVVPMTFARQWKWEHIWAVFSLLGMLVFNWALGLASIPHLGNVLQNTQRTYIFALVFFGGCWGIGAILFGLGMESLGMAVGYPIIMGLIFSLGALIAMLRSGSVSPHARHVQIFLIGTLVVLIGIALCSSAAAGKTLHEDTTSRSQQALGSCLQSFPVSCPVFQTWA